MARTFTSRPTMVKGRRCWRWILGHDQTGTSTTDLSRRPTPVSGDQKTLVIVANFRDAVVSPLRPGADCSIQAIGDRVFSDPSGYSVDALYREMSAGQVSSVAGLRDPTRCLRPATTRARTTPGRQPPTHSPRRTVSTLPRMRERSTSCRQALVRARASPTSG